MTKLEMALTSFLGQDAVTRSLARVLVRGCRRGRISYDEVQRLVKESADDVLLLATELRLLVPVRTLRSTAWEDRVFLAEPGVIYEMPNVIKFLVQNASQTGQWSPADALSELSRLAGDLEWERIPRLVERLGERSQDYSINAVEVRKVCGELSLEHKIDTLIAGFKGGGVMSPKLDSLAEVPRQGTLTYELNPSLFSKKRSEARQGD